VADITDKEGKVLKAVLTNDFTMSNGRVPEKYDGPDWIWSDCINDTRFPSGIEGKTLSGVVSSLCRKGLLKSDGECVALTEAGFTAAKAVA
jgi:hypothetical protein